MQESITDERLQSTFITSAMETMSARLLADTVDDGVGTQVVDAGFDT